MPWKGFFDIFGLSRSGYLLLSFLSGQRHSILQSIYKIASNISSMLLFTGNNEPGPRKCIDCKKSYKSCDCKVTPL